MARNAELRFVKGHGTGNDFILIPDHEGDLEITPEQVRYLCDRHFGLGADGVIRVVRTARVPEVAAMADSAEWFMDYRNADGSISEMCGNGSRVFARYLDATGLITDAEVQIATRGGLRTVSMESDLSITIDMGIPTTPPGTAVVTVGSRQMPAIGVMIPNPHAVSFVESLDDAGDLLVSPGIAPAAVFNEGANVEFVVIRGENHIAMRVFERGVGETLSCGTGACAAAFAYLRSIEAPVGREVRVDVPGGTLNITETEAGHLLLRGPADLVARGTVLLP
ncbi:MAG: diaminopimelate epimerase [Candidatus Nanopelagicales bacterium]